MSRPVYIVDYDSAWPELYESERWRVMRVIGGRVRCIEQIGSTSILGLGAKPIIAILAGVDDQENADLCVEALAVLGYDDVTPQPKTIDWYYCIGRRLEGPYCHLHLVREGSRFQRGHILFRDYLREKPDAAQEYLELKKTLAERHKYQRTEYNLAKTDFITSVVERALSRKVE